MDQSLKEFAKQFATEKWIGVPMDLEEEAMVQWEPAMMPQDTPEMLESLIDSISPTLTQLTESEFLSAMKTLFDNYFDAYEDDKEQLLQ